MVGPETINFIYFLLYLPFFPASFPVVYHPHSHWASLQEGSQGAGNGLALTGVCLILGPAGWGWFCLKVGKT